MKADQADKTHLSRKSPVYAWGLLRCGADGHGDTIRDGAAEALALGRRSLTEEADAFAAKILPILFSLQKSGVTDLRGLAHALNQRGVRTARGGRWHVSNVRNLLIRSAD